MKDCTMSGKLLFRWIWLVLVYTTSVESLNWTAQPTNPTMVTQGREVSLSWSYILTADEQTKSQTYFLVDWKKFNLSTSSFRAFASYLKVVRPPQPLFGEPNAPRIVVDRSTGTSSASLQFKNVRSEDEGMYKIEVSVVFPGTVAIAHQEFNVTVLVPSGIVNISSNQTVCEGSLVTLSCNATGKPTPTLNWTRVEDDGTDSAPLLPVVDGKYFMSNTQRNASGTYRCTADNGVGSPVNRTVRVKFEYSASVDGIVNSSNFVTEDDFFNMSCESSGEPKPSVSWIISSGKRIHGSILNFTRINRNNSGQYTCEAGNKCGNDSRSQTVEVFYPPVITYISRAKNISFIFDQNETIFLNCSADGKPPPNIYWRKDNFRVTFPFKIRGKQDEGNYSCFANNGAGDPDIENVSVIVEKYHPFNTILTASHKTVDVDVTFNLTCTAQANPPAKYIFYRGQDILNVSQNHVSVAILETSVGERIKEVNFRCIPFNDYGYGQTDDEKVAVNYPPVIIGKQTVVNISLAESANMSCQVEGNPDPRFVWTNDSAGDVLSNVSLLELNNVKDSVTGYYTCNATNYLGSDNFTTLVRVTRNHGIPVDLTVLKDFHSDYRDLNKEKSKAFIKEIEDGVAKKYENNHYFDRAEVKNLREGSVIVFLVLHFTTPVTLKEGLVELSSAVGGNIGPYNVTALKVVDEGTPTDTPSGLTNTPFTPEKKTTQSPDGLPWPIIGGAIGGAVVLVFATVVAWYVHKKRKCRRKDSKIHTSESEVLHNQNDIEDGAYARVNGGYAVSGPPSANGSKAPEQQQQPQQQEQQQQQASAAPPTYAAVDKSKKKNKDKKNGNENIPDYPVVDKSKKKKKEEAENSKKEEKNKGDKNADANVPEYAVVNKSKKKKKKEEDEHAYASVDMSRKSKKQKLKPGEVLYADLGDFQPVGQMPAVSTSPEPLPPIKRPPSYQETTYADITQFLTGEATLPAGQGTEMEPTYANSGGGKGEAAKENPKTGQQDTGPKETPM